MKFDQFFDLLIAQAYTMEENVQRRNKESFQQQNTNSAGRGCGRGGRGRGGQNRQANNTGTSSSNNNNQGYQGRGGQGRGRGVNNSGRGQGGCGNNNSNNSSWPKNKDGQVIGPSFKIQENMGFDYEEYVKLTPEQKQQLYSIRSRLQNDNQSNNNTNTSQNSQNNSSVVVTTMQLPSSRPIKVIGERMCKQQWQMLRFRNTQVPRWRCLKWMDTCIAESTC